MIHSRRFAIACGRQNEWPNHIHCGLLHRNRGLSPIISTIVCFRTLVALSLLLLVWIQPASAQVPSGVLSTDQITGAALNANDRSAVVLIHGWTDTDLQNAPENAFGEGSWPQLVSALTTRLNGTGSKLLLYNWEADASTGDTGSIYFIPFVCNPFGVGFYNASSAASNAFLNGRRLADSLDQAAPELRKITFIAHSAGSWAAYRALDQLLLKNPYVVANLVLLDPFIPGVDPASAVLTTARMSQLVSHPAADRIFRLENYYAVDLTDTGWCNVGGSSANATSQRFSWRNLDVFDINKEVDYWPNQLLHLGHYYGMEPSDPIGHSGPIRFYADTVIATTYGATVPNGLAFAPWAFTSVGFYRGLTDEGYLLLPKISVQPEAPTQPVLTGQRVTLSVSASRTVSFQWYKNGQPYPANSSTLTFSSVSASDAGEYVVRLTNTNGHTFSEKAVLQVAAIQTPTISSVSPPSLTTSTTPQTITIYGSNFTSSSLLVFYYPDNTQSPQRTPVFYSSGQLRYTSTFPTSGGWKVKVVNGPGVESTLHSFYVSSAPPSSATLTGLSISGPATVNENSTGSFTATALFSDSSTQTVSATWSVSGSAASINQSTGQLTAGSVLSDTPVTVSASYAAGGITKTASANVTIVNLGGSGTQTQNLIANGGFELGTTGWSVNPLAGGASTSVGIVQGSFPRGGTWYGYLGDQTTTAINALGSLHQFINIPANATSITLNFYLNIATAEPSSTSTWDKMDVNFRTSSDFLIKKFRTFSESDKGAYRLVTIDMSADLLPYKGQSVILQFYVDTDASKQTIFRIDDVSVIATVPAPVTLSSLLINGPSSVNAGGSALYSATAVFSDGSTAPVTATGWAVNSAFASISSNGSFSAGQVSSDAVVVVSASFTSGGVTRTATKNVTIVAPTVVPPTYSVLAISGPGSINENSSGQFVAVAIFSDGSSQAASPTWSLNSGVASISGLGLLTAGAVDTDTTLTVSASYTLGGITRNANQNVTIINLQQPVAPVITSAGTASGTVNQAFSYQVTATNSPTSYGASGLPAGLSVNPGTGLISGTPTVSGTFTVTVTAANGAGTGSMTLTITITTGSPVAHPFIDVTGATAQVHDLGVGTDGSVYVLFPTASPKALAVVKSTDGGVSWSSPVSVPNSAFSNFEYQLAVDSGGTVHVVWWLSNSSGTETYYSRSSNGAASFSLPIRVRSGNSYNGYRTDNAIEPVVAADGIGNVYVAYSASTKDGSGNFAGYNVWLSKSTDGGNSFQPEFPISTISSAQKKPKRIRATASNFYVLYLDETNYDLYFYRRNAGAASANTGRLNANTGSVQYGGDFAVAPSEMTFYAAYSDTTGDSEGNITFCKSTDGGITWPVCTRVNDTAYRWQYSPAVGLDSLGGLHAAWTDLRSNHRFQTYYSHSADGGATFSANVNVSAPLTENNFEQPHLVVDNSNSALYISATRDYSQVMLARRPVTPASQDPNPPTGSVVINSGASFTKLNLVSLVLNASDAVGVVGYSVKNSSTPPTAAQSGWTSVTPTTSYSTTISNWVISSPDGVKPVYAWYKDAAGNVSSTASATITLDQTPPTNGTLTPIASSGQVQLSWSGQTDATSGVAGYKLVFSPGTTPPADCSGTALATSSPYTHTGLTNGQAYSYRLCTTDNAGNTSPGVTATATPAGAALRGDFNGDGKPDLLWRNYSTGAVNIWFMNGTTYTGGATLFTVADPNWRIEGAGDFNGDARTDLIWRNYSTGAVNVWFMNGTTYTGGATLFSVADPNWKIEAVADFNGDAKDDLIWRNYVTGAVHAWFMNGSVYLSGASLFSVADPNWKIEAAGDFSGDGKTDLIWRNYATGAVNIWYLNGTTYMSGTTLFSVADANWRIEATADYNADGKLDLIWRNYSSGAVNVWFLNGSVYLSGASLLAVSSASWEIAGPR